MIHPLKGKKQNPEHAKKRMDIIRAMWKKNPRPFLDMGTKIQKKIKIDKNGCWVWQGSSFRKVNGLYSQMRVGRAPGKLRFAHRLSYEYYVGKVPAGLELDHLCRNTLCVNPKHLEPVTHRENMARGKLGEKRNFA